VGEEGEQKLSHFSSINGESGWMGASGKATEECRVVTAEDYYLRIAIAKIGKARRRISRVGYTIFRQVVPKRFYDLDKKKDTQ
jgi:hypothetical protein